MPGITRTTLPYLLILEINGGVLLCFFKKDPNHIHIQCFTETSRTGKQRYHRFRIQKITDQQGFIYIIIACGRRLEIRNPNGHRLFLFA